MNQVSTHAPLSLLEAEVSDVDDGTSASDNWSKVSFTKCSWACSGWRTGPEGRYVDPPFAKLARTTPLTDKHASRN